MASWRYSACSVAEDAFQFGKFRTNLLRQKYLIHTHTSKKWPNGATVNGQKELLRVAHNAEYTYERTVQAMLVFGTGSVFPRSSIHPKLLCSLPESLDARVKSDPHNTLHKLSYTRTVDWEILLRREKIFVGHLQRRKLYRVISHSKESALCGFLPVHYT